MDPVRDAPNNCSNPNHTNLVASFCNGMSNCVVPATNLFFGDPCPTIVKYLQINYHCETLIPSAIKESFTCEWQSKTLTCPSGQSIIVDYANYGRTTHPVCVMDPVRDGPNTCSNPSHTSVVATFCNGQSNCVVPATNFVFGDPCPTIVKYLQIQYHCAWIWEKMERLIIVKTIQGNFIRILVEINAIDIWFVSDTLIYHQMKYFLILKQLRSII
jgi:hypothetical protein